MDWESLMGLFNVIAWPLVVVLVLLLYRQSLATFIFGLGARVTKLSAFNVSIELAALPSPPSPWTDPKIQQSSEMRGGEVDSTALMELFNHIKTEERWHYLLVDIKDGRFWFVSRLYIFSIFLETMRDLKCTLFVQSSGKYRQRLLGVASSGALRSSLGQTFPWMERALTNAINQYPPNFLAPNLPSETAGNIVRAFIEDRDMRVRTDPHEMAKTAGGQPARSTEGPTDPVKPSEWLRLGDHEIWEHTRWLDLNIGKVSEAVTRSFYEHDSSVYVESADVTGDDKVRKVLSRKAPYIAVVNSCGEFKALLDREKLAALVGNASVK
jgi:hypothetical protein